MGTLGPSLAGGGSRYSAGELRLRIADMTRVKPDAAMPAYYRTEGLHEVAASYRGRTILTAQLVEDVVAYLQTLK
jgi:sulfur-oxidizing protein SoxX